MTFEAVFMKITYSTTTKLRLLSQFQNVNESLKVFADYHNVGAGSLKRWIQQYLTGGLANLERPYIIAGTLRSLSFVPSVIIEITVFLPKKSY